MSRTKLKRRLLNFILVLFGVLLSIFLLELMLRVVLAQDSLMRLPVNSTNPVIRFMGNRDVIAVNGANSSIITKKHVNNAGFLNDQNYDPGEQSPLLAIIGDSYVEATQVENQDTMYGLLQQETVGVGRVYSFGASGSPLSTYLAYAQYATKEFNADALVFIIVGNDFDESLMKNKSAPGFHYFLNESDCLRLVRIDYQPTLIRRILRKSKLARYAYFNFKLALQSIENMLDDPGGNLEGKYVGYTRADFDEERISDSKNVIDEFFEELPLQTGLGNEKILFIIDGMRPHLYDPALLMQAKGSYFDLMRAYFIEVAEEEGYEVIDMQPVFKNKHENEGIRFEFPSDGHWNEAGHKLVAEQIKLSAVYREVFNR